MGPGAVYEQRAVGLGLDAELVFAVVEHGLVAQCSGGQLEGVGVAVVVIEPIGGQIPGRLTAPGDVGEHRDGVGSGPVPGLVQDQAEYQRWYRFRITAAAGGGFAGDVGVAGDGKGAS